MINIMFFNRLDDEDRYILYLPCTQVGVKKPRLNYKTTRALSGKKRQSWDGVYHSFDISYEKISQEEFDTLNNLIDAQTGDTYMVYGDDFFVVDFEMQSFDFNKEYSPTIKEYIYTGSISIEETEGGN